MLWEYLAPASSTTKDIARSDALPENDTEYIPPEYYDLKSTAQTRTFRAIGGMTRAEYEDLNTALSERGVTPSVTDQNGTVWTGAFRSLSCEPIPGTNYVTDVQLAIQTN